MGWFSKLFGRKEENEEQEEIEEENTNKDRSRLYMTTDGRKVYEFYDSETKFGTFYDTTRMIISKEPMNIQGKELYDIMISWYGENDAVYIDPDGPKSRRDIYKHVIAGIDMNLMDNDKEYLKFVAKNLLNKNRVERYLQTGLMSEQEIEEEIARTGNRKLWPCGRYVGEAVNTSRGFVKGFSNQTGRMLHNTPEMLEERRAYKEMLRNRKQERIIQLRAEQAKAQEEIDRLSR